MGKSCNPDVLDAALDYLKTNVDLMVACSAEPTSYAEATSTYALADVAMSSGDFAIGAGDVSGRKLTVAQKSGVTIDDTGTVTHIALVNSDASELLYVTTCTSQSLTQGNTMTFNAWDIEIADPS